MLGIKTPKMVMAPIGQKVKIVYVLAIRLKKSCKMLLKARLNYYLT